MKQFVNAIGIDVSKATLDCHDHVGQHLDQVPNSKQGFKQFLKWARKNNTDLSQVLICFEHTGIYSLPLAVYLTEQKIIFSMVPGLQIKRSLGIQRGKSDKADAKAIARYAYLHRDEVKPYNLPSPKLLDLKAMLSLRQKMVSERAGYISAKKEIAAIGSIYSNSILAVRSKLIKGLTQQIAEVESQMIKMIQSDQDLKRVFDLVTSVKGVGLIVGVTIIVYTNCFTAFDDWRKFACYCGIAPFPYKSGTSIRGKDKIHYLANKRVKTLLSNAASSSIVHNPEMRAYYQRRLQEGKNKFSTQNIIRNKIISRVFAAVQRGTPYVDTFRFAA